MMQEEGTDRGRGQEKKGEGTYKLFANFLSVLYAFSFLWFILYTSDRVIVQIRKLITPLPNLTLFSDSPLLGK